MARLMSATLAILLLFSFRPTNAYDYKDALQKSLLFFEAQRSGKLPCDQRVTWRGDSGLSDGFQQGVDLVGGYYDSGDHVKFGFPMAFSVTMLSWAVIEFEKEFIAVDELKHALDAIRWGTDYFIKAHKEPNALWVQVGDGDSDHLCWERAEDMTTPRLAFKITTINRGSEVAGETAAAFAAASLAFRHYDSFYADVLLLHAKQLFTFADSFRGKYDDSVQCVKKFYPSSSGYNDELLWAAAWLYQATNDQYYLNYAAQNAAGLGGIGWAVTEFSWDNKYAGVQVLLSKTLLHNNGGGYEDTLKQYQAKGEFFLCAALQKNSGHDAKMTPGGLMYIDDWNNMQYVSSATFLMIVYSDYLASTNNVLNCPDGQVQPADILQFAQSQVDYILGKNPKGLSYLVGYGSNYPRHTHHRGASIPSISVLNTTVGCTEGFDKYYDSKDPDPNVIYGALVGGPDSNDAFTDERSNYQQTEPTLVGSAPLVGIFARLTSCPSSTPSQSYSTPADNKPDGAPLTFVHTVTDSWTANGEQFYRHSVTGTNACGKTITYLKLKFDGLTGPLYGLNPTDAKTMFEFPAWITALAPNSQFSFVYIQGGEAAQITVEKYTAN
ncbi:Endoglucanase [Rhynchospora pubera]|uniref:cellulase n=1 Tax=Rhynchospora pubera TaxID=906938 RepID=A0AAV8F0U7_9POAL|nr:Endoglucanase [Rhynchospora pubera]